MNCGDDKLNQVALRLASSNVRSLALLDQMMRLEEGEFSGEASLRDAFRQQRTELLNAIRDLGNDGAGILTHLLNHQDEDRAMQIVTLDLYREIATPEEYGDVITGWIQDGRHEQVLSALTNIAQDDPNFALELNEAQAQQLAGVLAEDVTQDAVLKQRAAMVCFKASKHPRLAQAASGLVKRMVDTDLSTPDSQDDETGGYIRQNHFSDIVSTLAKEQQTAIAPDLLRVVQEWPSLQTGSYTHPFETAVTALGDMDIQDARPVLLSRFQQTFGDQPINQYQMGRVACPMMMAMAKLGGQESLDLIRETVKRNFNGKERQLNTHVDYQLCQTITQIFKNNHFSDQQTYELVRDILKHLKDQPHDVRESAKLFASNWLEALSANRPAMKAILDANKDSSDVYAQMAYYWNYSAAERRKHRGG